jgi:hypothetical protein
MLNRGATAETGLTRVVSGPLVTVGDTTVVDTSGMATVVVSVADGGGGFSNLSVVLEASFDGVTYVTVPGYRFASGLVTIPSTTISLTGRVYVVNIAGFNHFRARLATLDSGSVIATIAATAAAVSPRALDAATETTLAGLKTDLDQFTFDGSGKLFTTIGDGADVSEGSITDPAWSGSGDGTVIAILKKLATAGGGATSIADGSDVAEGTTTDPAWSGSGAGTVIALLKKIASGGGSAVSIADGSDVVEGTLSDGAILSDTTGTVNGKLRGLIKIFASVWDSTNSRLKVDGSGVTQPVSDAVMHGTIANPGFDAVQAVAVQGVTSGEPLTITGSISNLFLLSSTYAARTPNGASPADGESNTITTLSRIGAFPFFFNGTTWDRWQGRNKVWDGTNTAAVKAAASAALTTDPALVVAISPNNHVTADQGAAGTFTSPWMTKFSDGGNVVLFKAASTAVAATDVSIPVGLSPNSPLPAGSNTLGKVDQGVANATPWNMNAAQWGGAATSLGQKAAASSVPVVPASDWLTEAVPTGGFGNPALRVFVNSIRKATFQAVARNISSGALVANTNKAIVSFEHAAGSTKNMRVRRIYVTGVVTTAGAAAASDLAIAITSGTAATTAGTVITPGKANPAESGADTVVKSLPTIVAATAVATYALTNVGAGGLTINLVIPRTLIYDWSEAGSTEPLTLRAANLDSLVINALSSSTPTVSLTVEVEFTEE